MLDHGSQVTMISEEFVNTNRMKMRKSTIPSKIGGITGNSMPAEHFVNLILLSWHNSFELEIEAEVVSRIPYFVETSLITNAINSYSNMKFAETKMPSNRVDIIIGAEYYERCIRNANENFGTVFLRDTGFGWVISGPYVIENQAESSFCGVTVVTYRNNSKNFGKLRKFQLLKPANSSLSVSNARNSSLKLFSVM